MPFAICLPALSRVVIAKTDPRNWRGGEISAYTAWLILYFFNAVDKNPANYYR